MSTSKKKISFIKSWYNSECEKLSFNNKLKLSRVWIDICTKDEEYEMANALVAERRKMVIKHVKEKRARRSFLKRMSMWTYIQKRKIKILIKKLIKKMLSI